MSSSFCVKNKNVFANNLVLKIGVVSTPDLSLFFGTF